MTEKQMQLTEKIIRNDMTHWASLWAKTTMYRAMEAPIIYNFYSNADVTIFIYKDNRKKIYKLMGNGFNKTRDYMPMAFGRDFDTLKTCKEYPQIRKWFLQLIKMDILDQPIDLKKLENNHLQDTGELKFELH